MPCSFVSPPWPYFVPFLFSTANHLLFFSLELFDTPGPEFRENSHATGLRSLRDPALPGGRLRAVALLDSDGVAVETTGMTPGAIR